MRQFMNASIFEWTSGKWSHSTHTHTPEWFSLGFFFVCWKVTNKSVNETSPPYRFAMLSFMIVSVKKNAMTLCCARLTRTYLTYVRNVFAIRLYLRAWVWVWASIINFSSCWHFCAAILLAINQISWRTTTCLWALIVHSTISHAVSHNERIIIHVIHSAVCNTYHIVYMYAVELR